MDIFDNNWFEDKPSDQNQTNQNNNENLANQDNYDPNGLNNQNNNNPANLNGYNPEDFTSTQFTQNNGVYEDQNMQNGQNGAQNPTDQIQVLPNNTNGEPQPPVELLTKPRKLGVAAQVLATICAIGAGVITAIGIFVLFNALFGDASLSGFFGNEVNAYTLGIAGLAGMLVYVVMFFVLALVGAAGALIITLEAKTAATARKTRLYPKELFALSGKTLADIILNIIVSVPLAIITGAGIIGGEYSLVLISIFAMAVIMFIIAIILICDRVSSRRAFKACNKDLQAEIKTFYSVARSNYWKKRMKEQRNRNLGGFGSMGGIGGF